MRPYLLLVPFALFTIACGGDDGPPLGGDVVGSWRELPNATDDEPPMSVADRLVVTFTADGNYTIVSPSENETGTYSIDGDRMTLGSVDSGGDPHSFSIPYSATSARFLLGAYAPVGEADGLVGTWTATMVEDGQARTITMTLRADATSSYAMDYADATQTDATWNGTWRAIGDDVEVALMPDPNFTVRLRATLVDGMIGAPYERI